MQRDFDIAIERDSAGSTWEPSPRSAAVIQARSLDELMERMQVAVELCLKVEGEEVEPMTFVGVQRISGAARAVCPVRPGPWCAGRRASLPLGC